MRAEQQSTNYENPGFCPPAQMALQTAVPGQHFLTPDMPTVSCKEIKNGCSK